MIKHLVAVGGGTLLDEAKRFVHDEAPDVALVAIPSVWGSGAEASPVVVLNRDGKQIRTGDEYLPAARAVWPELAESLSERRAIDACGDAWAHAMEGFLSPLATNELRRELAEVIRTMIDLPLTNDPRWFEPSARAAALQARSSVGLVHGIAHTIELPLARALGDDWGHARLCALYLAPVLRLDRAVGTKLHALFLEFDLDESKIKSAALRLFDDRLYQATLPVLEAEWRNVLRDRCTRTNSVLVRADHLAHFLTFLP